MYIDFETDIYVSNNVVGNIDIGFTLSDLLDVVDTNGDVILYDKNEILIDDKSVKLKTGDKLIVEFLNEKIIYTISVNGDVNGDGMVNDIDISLVSDYLIKNDVINGAAYLKSADIDNNGKIDINDVIKLSRITK